MRTVVIKSNKSYRLVKIGDYYQIDKKVSNKWKRVSLRSKSMSSLELLDPNVLLEMVLFD